MKNGKASSERSHRSAHVQRRMATSNLIAIVPAELARVHIDSYFQANLHTGCDTKYDGPHPGLILFNARRSTPACTSTSQCVLLRPRVAFGTHGGAVSRSRPVNVMGLNIGDMPKELSNSWLSALSAQSASRL
ncbi:hypothetical protein LIA77_06729 [Sarocladium implicatum]|nr:hypothetical protein LIA77_06729 [Sarocladium implicatum]